MNPAIADSYKYVSFAGQYGVEDNFTPKEFFIELDTFINIRGKDMNVMNVTNHSRFLLRCGSPPYSKSYYKDNLKVNKLVNVTIMSAPLRRVLCSFDI